MDKSLFPFTHTLRVRYSEIDGQKVVYNSHYLTYLDVAIIEYFRHIGIEFLDSSMFDLALVKATLEFKKPARLDDLLDVHVSLPRLGNKSFTGRFRISQHGKEDETCLEAEIVYVSYSEKEGRAVPIPGWVRERIGSFENSAR